jgi:hypothetical protein
LKGKISIAVDVDGTIVEHKYPDMGKEVPCAFYYLKKLREMPDVTLILWTVRSHQKDRGRDTLQEAIDYCKERGIEFDGINKNPHQTWSNSNKQYANFYIDDYAIGTALVTPTDGGKPYVDWTVIGPLLLEKIKNLRSK